MTEGREPPPTFSGTSVVTLSPEGTDTDPEKRGNTTANSQEQGSTGDNVTASSSGAVEKEREVKDTMVTEGDSE